MKSPALLLFTLLLLLRLNTVAQNREIEFMEGSFTELLAAAQKENKILFLDGFTTWCGPCKWMAKNIFTNDTVADFHNSNFINAKIDMEKGEGPEIAKKYGIMNYPTMIYLDAEGNQLHRICGARHTHELIADGNNALEAGNRLSYYSSAFQDKKSDSKMAYKYFSMLEDACLPYDEEVKDYFADKKESEYIAQENWKIMHRFVNDYFSKPFQYLEGNQEKFASTYGAERIEQKIIEVYKLGLYASIKNNDLQVFETIKTKLRASKVKDSERIILEADIEQAYQAKDWKRYANFASDYIQEYASEDANELNNFAWTFYERIDDKIMLAKAEGWAKKACELDDSYATNDTYAAVLYKLGKKAEALAAAERAIQKASENGEEYQATEELLQKINKLK